MLVKPGEKVPADGEVVEGRDSRQRVHAHRRVPAGREGQPGAEVIGGSVNGEGSLVVEIRKTGRDSYLSQVIELVRQAQESKSRTQDLADRAALVAHDHRAGRRRLTFVRLAGAGRARALAFALERAVTVMVIACPHALGLAMPLVVAVSTAAVGPRTGLLIRDRTAFESARNIQAVIFDKTGTLTEGRFGVTDIVSLVGSRGRSGRCCGTRPRSRRTPSTPSPGASSAPADRDLSRWRISGPSPAGAPKAA